MREVRLYNEKQEEVERWYSAVEIDNEAEYKIYAFSSGLIRMRKHRLDFAYIVIVIGDDILARQFTLETSKYKKLTGWEKVN